MLAAPGEKHPDHLGALPHIKDQFLPDGTPDPDVNWQFESADLTLFGSPYLTYRSMALYENDDDLGLGKGSSKKDGNVGRMIACCNITPSDD